MRNFEVAPDEGQCSILSGLLWEGTHEEMGDVVKGRSDPVEVRADQKHRKGNVRSQEFTPQRTHKTGPGKGLCHSQIEDNPGSSKRGKVMDSR